MLAMIPSADQIEFWLFTVLSAGVGAYFGSYLKKRGENRAIHEDFKKVLREVEETREATKAIEARIDDQVWNRQRQWETKKEIFIEASQIVAKAEAMLTKAVSAYLNGNALTEQFRACEELWFELAAHGSTIVMVSKSKTITTFSSLTQAFISTVLSLTPGELNDAVARNNFEAFRTTLATFYLATREELGIAFADPAITPQSNVFSAAPAPAPPAPK